MPTCSVIQSIARMMPRYVGDGCAMFPPEISRLPATNAIHFRAAIGLGRILSLGCLLLYYRVRSRRIRPAQSLTLISSAAYWWQTSHRRHDRRWVQIRPVRLWSRNTIGGLPASSRWATTANSVATPGNAERLTSQQCPWIWCESPATPRRLERVRRLRPTSTTPSSATLPPGPRYSGLPREPFVRGMP